MNDALKLVRVDVAIVIIIVMRVYTKQCRVHVCISVHARDYCKSFELVCLRGCNMFIMSIEWPKKLHNEIG